MVSISTVVLLFSLLFFSRCWAQDVIVNLNDSRITTVPAGFWTDPTVRYQAPCGGSRWISNVGESASFTFTGVGLKINFLHSWAGGRAAVSIDGATVATLDTYMAGVTSRDCYGQPWTSAPLTASSHTLTVTFLTPNPDALLGSGDSDLYISNFVYTTSSSGSTATGTGRGTSPTTSPNGSTSTKKKSNTGVIVGATVGGIVALAALFIGILFLRKRSRGSSVAGQSEASRPMVDQYMQSPAQGSFYNPVSTAGTPRYDQPFMPQEPGYLSAVPAQAPNSPNMLPYAQPMSPAPMSPAPSYMTQSTDASQPRYVHTAAAPANIPAEHRFSQSQVELLQRLQGQNIPAPALATIMESMAPGGAYSGVPSTGSSPNPGGMPHPGNMPSPGPTIPSPGPYDHRGY